MEAINELLPLIATVLLLGITMGVVIAHNELMTLRDELYRVNHKLDAGINLLAGTQEVKVTNPVTVSAYSQNPLPVQVMRFQDHKPLKVEVENRVVVTQGMSDYWNVKSYAQ